MELDALVKVVRDNGTNLKVTCVLLLVYVLINTAMDIVWESKGKNNGKEIL
ncbi:hypothetical protein B0P06_005206 [Clostridium saccharoperbutylacetonicum]|uniref:hypothetical protein n=1 Tax=Clostridium saccharoperbutylacetonicum TaxID=36745 RepID=UPI00034D9841|nr:hypothetical protein [Clostridium saccharoperbutylacetonicum]NSB45435.1 hypothetical protein [Clostridium saccharoperbutylacetonicum]